jgi:23S rRNA (cytidine1920-2'-O)/16S rRNA (cytidine1409-2'-O)-methyltransferase
LIKHRLDNLLVLKGLVETRSQAETYIKLGKVEVDGVQIKKTGAQVSEKSVVLLTAPKTYVSRAALKLASVVDMLKVDFYEKTVLDVGSSTGGFTDYALSRGANKIIAVDVGSGQLSPRLRGNPKIELHEQTDIRSMNRLSTKVDIVLIDVSFISLRQILPHVSRIIDPRALVLAMVKPQFELGSNSRKNKGVIKNNTIRRQILKDFEKWVQAKFKILDKADSEVLGDKGNQERFYLLSKIVEKSR